MVARQPVVAAMAGTDRLHRVLALATALGLLLLAAGAARQPHDATVAAGAATPVAGDRSEAITPEVVAAEAVTPEGAIAAATATLPSPMEEPDGVVPGQVTEQASAAPTVVAEATAPAPPGLIARPGLTDGATRAADPGARVAFRHTLTNHAAVPVMLNIRATSASGWPVEIFAAEGTDPPADGNDIAGGGSLAAGASLAVTVQVAVPADAPAGQEDATTLRVAAGDLVVRAVDVVRVNAVVDLRVESADVAFGEVRGSGEVDPAVTGVTSSLDAEGAFYVRHDAIRLTIVSNAPWTLACFAQDLPGSAPDVPVAAGRLAWRASGTDAWQAFAVGPPGGLCVTTGERGVHTISLDLRLRVELADAPGSVLATVGFVAAPAVGPALTPSS